MKAVFRVREIRRRGEAEVGAATQMAEVGGGRMNCMGDGEKSMLDSPLPLTGLARLSVSDMAACTVLFGATATPPARWVRLVALDEITGRPDEIGLWGARVGAVFRLAHPIGLWPMRGALGGSGYVLSFLNPIQTQH